MVAQSVPVVPEASWQRVFLAAWLISCLVVTAAYSCDLVRIFTRVTYPRRLHTLRDLTHSHYRYLPTSRRPQVGTGGGECSALTLVGMNGKKGSTSSTGLQHSPESRLGGEDKEGPS